MKFDLPCEVSELAVMLCTRFCHDLAGPVSAVNNGLEFYNDVSDDQEMRDQAMGLLSMSAKESQAKLQMVRVAFGRADGGSSSSIESFKEIVSEYFMQGKIIIEWSLQVSSIGMVNNKIRRILAGMILVASSFMVYGGKILIEVCDNESENIIVIGENNKIKIDNEIISILNGAKIDEDVALSPHNIMAWMLCFMVKEMGCSISMQDISSDIEQQIKLQFTCT